MCSIFRSASVAVAKSIKDGFGDGGGEATEEEVRRTGDELCVTEAACIGGSSDDEEGAADETGADEGGGAVEFGPRGLRDAEAAGAGERPRSIAGEPVALSGNASKLMRSEAVGADTARGM